MNLTDILTQVADHKLSVAEAEKLIRQGPPRSQVRPRNTRLVGLIFLILGSVFGSVGIVVGYFSWSFTQGALEVEGTVVQLVRTGSRNSQAPLVRYQLDGQAYEIQANTSSSPPAYNVGEKVTVLYHAAQPDQGRLYSFVEFWLFPVIFGSFGALFFSIGCVVLLTGRTQWQLNLKS